MSVGTYTSVPPAHIASAQGGSPTSLPRMTSYRPDVDNSSIELWFVWSATVGDAGRRSTILLSVIKGRADA